MTRVTLTTAATPGAVAILQLQGDRLPTVLHRLTERADFAPQHAYLCDFAGIDEGLAIQLDDTAAQLMPHGGPRVVQRLLEHLTADLGCVYDADPDPQTLYPEAASPIEADMLHAIATAASPAAIDLLAQQPAQWRGLLQQARKLSQTQRQHISQRSRTLNQLIHPPTVVVVGPPNVGKSTLTNTLLGKQVSIVADLPGTTRDYVGALVELGSSDWDLGQSLQADEAQDPSSQSPIPNSLIAVHWLDTPGLRASDDTIEQRAIALARKQIERAEVVIAMRDADSDWPSAATLPREPDLYVVNKVDEAEEPAAEAGRSPDDWLEISAARALNLDALQARVIDALGLARLACEPWAFSTELSDALAADDLDRLSRYLASPLS